MASLIADIKQFGNEIKEELTPITTYKPKKLDAEGAKSIFFSIFYIPFFPAFYRPGWLKRYVMGPHTPELLEMFFSDLWAGVIVAMTLIPQGLSYAQLANVPAINGLYCAVLPSATYTFLGSSMQLGVGPVAIVSLLTGQLVAKFVPKWSTDSKSAIELTAQVCLTCGIYLLIMSLFKIGNFIRFISYPVMSGFTTAAAMLIGLSQVKNAFGFPSDAPQQGQPHYDHNFEVMHWFGRHWNDYNYKKGLAYRNHFCVSICFGLYIPLIIIWSIKKFVIPPTPERKKQVWFRVFTFIANIMPLFAIIIGASVAKKIITDPKASAYAKAIKIVGNLPAGLKILRNPSYPFDWGEIFSDTIQLTLVSFMESYSVARRIASQRNELHILNASQELFAIGIANMVGAVSSCFPVSGSFSRSSLNAASGARTPLSKATTMCIICMALGTLTTQFYYIPNAALSAIIWVAITDLISFGDFWRAWRHNKMDFVVMFVTFFFVFVLDTGIGLAIGLGLSALVLLYENAYSSLTGAKKYVPAAIQSADDLAALNGVEVVRVNNDITFVSVPRLEDYLTDMVESKSELLRAIILDLVDVKLIDYTGLITLENTIMVIHTKGVQIGYINATEHVQGKFDKFKMPFDELSEGKSKDGLPPALFKSRSDSKNSNDVRKIAVAEKAVPVDENKDQR